ncbi:MAG: LamG domain-containing protein [Thiohalospira sp.]
MENNINDKKNNNNSMKTKLSLIFFGLCIILGFTSVFAEQEILSIPFEESAGSYVYDYGTSNIIFDVIGSSWESTPKKWGQYSMEFDGNDDNIFSDDENLSMPHTKSLSFWIYYLETTDSDMDNLFQAWNDDEQLIIKYSANNDKVEIFETDSTGELIQYNFTPSLNISQWHHVVFTWTNTTLSLWVDNNIIDTIPLSNPDLVSRNYENLVFGIATNGATGDDLYANLDSIRFYDFTLSSNQIQNLNENDYTPTSTFTSTTIDEDDIDSIEQLDFIEYFSLEEGENYSNPVEFELQLNQTANCELYINREFSCEKENILSCNRDFALPYGENSAQAYCYFYAYDEGQLKKYYDSTDYTQFNVSAGEPGSVAFTVTGKDFVIDDYNFYVVSPCLKEGLTHLVSDQAYSSVFNPDGVIIEKLNSGYAELNITAGDYEICLFHGIIDHEVDGGKTTEYNINKFYNQIEIGTLTSRENQTQAFAIELETFDIYGKTNPKAWGTTWASIILGVVGLVIGLGIMFVGVQTNMPKFAIVGAILVMLSLGFSITGLFAVLV